jgi:hypothetical protein
MKKPTSLPTLVALLDGQHVGTGCGPGPVGDRTGVHTIAAYDGLVPVAEVYSYGAEGSIDNGPIRRVSEDEARALAEMFARSPAVFAAAREAYRVSCRVPCDPKLSNAIGALYRALEGIEL